jgi:Na+/proline symporter
LALFASYYGTRYVDASEKKRYRYCSYGINLEASLLLIIGIYVTYFVFDGFDDIIKKLRASGSIKHHRRTQWDQLVLFVCCFYVCYFLVARQFHTAIIENNETHIKTAIWLFPIFCFSIFCIFQSLGEYSFEGKGHNADTYSLLIPQLFDNNVLTIMVFLGGFRQLFQ